VGTFAGRQLQWFALALILGVVLVLVASILFGAPVAHGWAN
jgi:preprotein translocase subunit SecF